MTARWRSIPAGRAWNNRANSLRALQRFDEALASAERALAINPDFAQAWSIRGAILRDLHRPDDAMASLDRAISLAPDDAAALFNRATLQGPISRYRPALDDGKSRGAGSRSGLCAGQSPASEDVWRRLARFRRVESPDRPRRAGGQTDH